MSITSARFRRLLRDAALLATSGSYSTGEKPTVFPIAQAQADLLFVQAASGEQVLRLASIDAFAYALASVGARCHGACGVDALRALCDNELLELGKRLPASDGIQSLVAMMAEPEIVALLRANGQLLTKVFCRYAVEINKSSHYRKGHWTLSAASRWSADFNLASGLSHQALHEFFIGCTRHEVAKGGLEGKLSFQGFHLLVIAISQYLYAKTREMPHDRLALSLRCMKSLL
jgi:hypothetical protein